MPKPVTNRTHHTLTTTSRRCRACLGSTRFDTISQMDAHHRAAQDRYVRRYGTSPGVHLPRTPKPCGCRAAKTHPDCQYCGAGFWGEVVCGRCHAAGIDGKLIKGTGARRCSRHTKGRK
jgi:hypothetical protein